MANKHRWSTAEMATALRETRGIKAAAARRLGCTVDTIDNYIARFPTVAQANKEARDSIVDLAEAQLVKHLNAGLWSAVQYTLSTLGRDRGYGAQIDINVVVRQEVARIVERDGLSADEADELEDSIRQHLKAAR